MPEYKSNDEITLMEEDEVVQYQSKMDEFSNKMEGNCGSTTSVVGASQSNSPARQWGAENRALTSIEKKKEYLKSARNLNKKYTDIGVNKSIKLKFTDELSTKLENSLEYMENNNNDLFKRFKITDGFRDANDIYGATDSLHKYGGAFDWNYSEFTEEEREKIYGIFCFEWHMLSFSFLEWTRRGDAHGISENQF